MEPHFSWLDPPSHSFSRYPETRTTGLGLGPGPQLRTRMEIHMWIQRCRDGGLVIVSLRFCWFYQTGTSREHWDSLQAPPSLRSWGPLLETSGLFHSGWEGVSAPHEGVKVCQGQVRQRGWDGAEINSWTGAESAVMGTLYQNVLVKRELILKVKICFYFYLFLHNVKNTQKITINIQCRGRQKTQWAYLTPLPK